MRRFWIGLLAVAVVALGLAFFNQRAAQFASRRAAEGSVATVRFVSSGPDFNGWDTLLGILDALEFEVTSGPFEAETWLEWRLERYEKGAAAPVLEWTLPIGDPVGRGISGTFRLAMAQDLNDLTGRGGHVIAKFGGVRVGGRPVDLLQVSVKDHLHGTLRVDEWDQKLAVAYWAQYTETAARPMRPVFQLDEGVAASRVMETYANFDFDNVRVLSLTVSQRGPLESQRSDSFDAGSQ